MIGYIYEERIQKGTRGYLGKIKKNDCPVRKFCQKSSLSLVNPTIATWALNAPRVNAGQTPKGH